MTKEELAKLERFEAHFHLLLEKYQELKTENTDLRARLAEQETTLLHLKAEKEELCRKYDDLKVARVISLNATDVDSAKKRMAKLVREVDKCIALLNS